MSKLILLLSLACVGCASVNAMQNCQKQAGPKPYAWSDSFGVVGVLAAGQSEERQTWYKNVDDCMAAWRASNP